MSTGRPTRDVASGGAGRPSRRGAARRPERGAARAAERGGSRPHERVASRARTGIASSTARFQARAADVRRRPWRLAAWATLAVAVVAALVWLVAFSPVLAVRSIEVVGVPDSEVAPITELAKGSLGTPLARVDGRALAERVSQRATLADVSIERSWPGTLVIHASPRVPVLVVRNPQGQLKVVDRDGVAYAQVKQAPKGVPTARAASDEALSPDALRAAVSVVTVLPPSLRSRVSDVTVSSADLVTFKVDRTTVVWGGMAAPEQKLRIVTTLLGTKPRVIDVSAPDTPVTR